MDCNIESQLSENGVNPQFLEKSIQSEEIGYFRLVVIHCEAHIFKKLAP